MVYWRFEGKGGMKKEKQVRWRDLTRIWRHLCVCPILELLVYYFYGVPSSTEATLFYNI